MATRIKADPMVIGDLEQADRALLELTQLERARRGILDEMNEAIDARKEKAKAVLAPLDARSKELTDALAVYLKMNREAVLKNRKSVELAFGSLGFRASTAIAQIRGVTAQMSLERIKEGGFEDGIRVKEELDKDALRAWPAERLAQVGLRRVEKDQFFVELKEEKISERAEA